MPYQNAELLLRETVASIVYWDALLRSYSNGKVDESVTRLYLASQKHANNKWRTLHEGVKTEDDNYTETAYRCLSEELRLSLEIIPHLFGCPESTGISVEEPFSTVLEHEIYRGKRLHYYVVKQKGICRRKINDDCHMHEYSQEERELRKLAYMEQDAFLASLKPQEANIAARIIETLPPTEPVGMSKSMPTDIRGLWPVYDSDTPDAIVIPIDNVCWIGM